MDRRAADHRSRRGADAWRAWPRSRTAPRSRPREPRRTIDGAPTIPPVDITPFQRPPNSKVPFPSQTAADKDTARIPQDLTSFIAAGTITQAMLTDPNTVLRNHIAAPDHHLTTTIVISTSPAAPLFGGGTDNIAFLLGNPAASAPERRRP